jgi:hypothetical protein
MNSAAVLPPTCSLRSAMLLAVRYLRIDLTGSAARDMVWIAEITDSMAERNRRAIWGAMNAPGEDAAISRDSLPLASRGIRMVERV